MKSVRLAEARDRAALCKEAAQTLARGGVVCLPCGGRYRLMADLGNAEAVLHLLQSKSRTTGDQALVFVPDEGHLCRVAGEVPPRALELARRIWPAPLTLRLSPHPDLPRALVKQLGGGRARIGVRVPTDSLARAVVMALGAPVLVSSANREHRTGETSPAGVRRTFVHHVALFIDAGDLVASPPSTVVEIVDGEVKITREGAVPPELLLQVA